MLSVEQTEDEKKEGNPLGGRKPAGIPAVLNPQDEKNDQEGRGEQNGESAGESRLDLWISRSPVSFGYMTWQSNDREVSSSGC